MSRKNVVVVLPTYNERGNILPLLQEIQKQGRGIPWAHLSILVVDDDSPDGTGKIVEKYSQTHPNVGLLRGKKRGLGRACIRGFKYALDEMGAHIILEMDADFSHHPSDIPRLLTQVRKGNDLVIGSRYVQGGSISDWPWWRRVSSKMANFMARYVVGLRGINDCTSGFRAMKAGVLKDINLDSLKGKGYAFLVSILHRAVRRGAKVEEVPIHFTNRKAGQSKIRLLDVLGFVLEAFRLGPIPLLLLIIFSTFVLRIPSFFEPLWYGDEGISLTLAQAMRRGAVLYRDICDNKPPLFYSLLSFSPTLVWAKILVTIFVLSTEVAIFFLARKLFSSKTKALGAALVFGILASLPLFEGNIANGEILALLPTVLGVALGLSAYEKRSKGRLLVAGIFFSLASLIKIPFVFDFLAFLIFCFLFLRWRSAILELLLGFALPWILVLSIFAFRGAGGSFLNSVFLRNVKYVGVGRGLFPGWVKNCLLAFLLLLVPLGLGLGKELSSPFKFLVLWFLFSLSGAFLSGRPYIHYLIQVFPPLSLLFVYVFSKASFLKKGLSASLCLLFFASCWFLPFHHYPGLSYYQNFLSYAQDKKSWEEYGNFFDPKVSRKYEIAGYILKNTKPDEEILVLGDEPGIYALSQRAPALKFVANYHIDAAGAWEEVKGKLLRSPPALVVLIEPEKRLSSEFWKKYKLKREIEGVKVFVQRS